MFSLHLGQTRVLGELSGHSYVKAVMRQIELSKIAASCAMALTIAAPTLLPVAAQAQSWKQKQDHRQATKNQWRNLGIAGGALGVLGLLSGNKTLAALGIGGGLYAASRYEADRKSQNRDARGRYELFRRSSFDHNGHHYVRRTKTVKGQKYYYFQKTR